MISSSMSTKPSAQGEIKQWLYRLAAAREEGGDREAGANPCTPMQRPQEGVGWWGEGRTCPRDCRRGSRRSAAARRTRQQRRPRQARQRRPPDLPQKGEPPTLARGKGIGRSSAHRRPGRLRPSNRTGRSRGRRREDAAAVRPATPRRPATRLRAYPPLLAGKTGLDEGRPTPIDVGLQLHRVPTNSGPATPPRPPPIGS